MESASVEPTSASEMAAKWKKYEFLDGLYRFYLNEIISFHMFYLPVVGGIVAYVLAHQGKPIALGLVVPLIVSAGAACIFFPAIKESEELNKAIMDSARELVILPTHAKMLVRAVIAFFLLHFTIVIFSLLAGGSLLLTGHVFGLPAS